MAIEIACVPVLRGEASDSFEQQMAESTANKGKIDFSKQIEAARKILAKAHL